MMLCERYHARISADTCSVRHFRATVGRHQGAWRSYDPGCVGCRQGEAVRAALAAGGLRECTLCGLEKPRGDFYPMAGGAGGLEARCKICKKQLRNDRRKEAADGRG